MASDAIYTIAPIFAALPMPGRLTSIHLRCEKVINRNKIDWKDIDILLTDQNVFVDLDRVVITPMVYDAEDLEEGEEEMKMRLRSVDKAGTLEFEYEGRWSK